MEEFQIWTLWASNRAGTALVSIGIILAIWLSLRIAAATRASDEANVIAKIISTAFGLIVVAFAWQLYTIGGYLWIVTARAITDLKEQNGSISEGAQAYLEYVGTTEALTTPTPLGIAFLAVVTIIILTQIWLPKQN